MRGNFMVCNINVCVVLRTFRIKVIITETVANALSKPFLNIGFV